MKKKKRRKKKKDENRVTQQRRKPGRRQKPSGWVLLEYKHKRTHKRLEIKNQKKKLRQEKSIQFSTHTTNPQPITIQIPGPTMEQRGPTLRNFPANWVPDLRSFFSNRDATAQSGNGGSRCPTKP